MSRLRQIGQTLLGLGGLIMLIAQFEDEARKLRELWTKQQEKS